MQSAIIFADGIMLLTAMAVGKDDFFEAFFVRNGMVSENIVLTLFFLLDITASVIIAVLVRRYKKENIGGADKP